MGALGAALFALERARAVGGHDSGHERGDAPVSVPASRESSPC
jgi:hypothetical protein